MTADLLTKNAAKKVWLELVRALLGMEHRYAIDLIAAQARERGAEYPVIL